MTHFERATVREIFKRNYNDFAVYRWLNRNKDWLRKLFVASGVIVNVLALVEIYRPLLVWAVLFIGVIWLGAIDNFFIGLRLKKILRICEDVTKKQIGLVKLLEICKNEIPE